MAKVDDKKGKAWVSMFMPVLPQGFVYSGGWRVPKVDEYYLWCGEVKRRTNPNTEPVPSAIVETAAFWRPAKVSDLLNSGREYRNERGESLIIARFRHRPDVAWSEEDRLVGVSVSISSALWRSQSGAEWQHCEVLEFEGKLVHENMDPQRAEEHEYSEENQREIIVTGEATEEDEPTGWRSGDL